MKKFSFLLFVVLMIGSLLTGCASTDSISNGDEGKAADGGGGDKELVIGFSQMENNNPWRIAETKSIREEAEKRGYKMVYTDAQSDTSKQVSDVEDMIAQGVDYIVLAPREFDGLAPALESAQTAGIPVILVDRMADGEHLTFIGSNFVKQGQRAGEWLVEATGGNAKIVELTGTTGSSVAIDRQKGFMDVIDQQEGMEVIASQTGDFARAEGQKVMENLLQSHGDDITAVYAHNDEMAIGAINAIEVAGKTPGEDITIVSVDGTKDALQSIIDGKMGATVESSPFFGPTVFDVIEKHAGGEEIEKEIIIEDRFFDKDNAEEFVDEAY
ncbi:ABC transporter substrate-binding protein [Pseudalkalibacillus sp. A8]|uniref:ABC transporter substrate-binding protein n=1 Tax=Pseudalkalibacillus sp. A8 TaxID=3382641 RepID=UPI0038B67538